jgi:hypothetical protein
VAHSHPCQYLIIANNTLVIDVNIITEVGNFVNMYCVIKFVSDLWQVGGVLWVHWFPPPIKTVCHDITKILLKVALNTIKQNKKNINIY